MSIKPYQHIPIIECGEPLLPLPEGILAFFDPHPYIALGAGPDYGSATPWALRQGTIQAIEISCKHLDSLKRGWKIKIFDAFRPNAVQHFMVEREYRLLAEKAGFDPENLTQVQRESLTPAVLRLWAVPSNSPLTPPPHSTGAALDCTLVDETGTEIFMGSPIDENSARSNPNFYANDADTDGQQAHKNRMLLNEVMEKAGFVRHPSEWWHFSLGDQMWAWAKRQADLKMQVTARYGSAEKLTLV